MSKWELEDSPVSGAIKVKVLPLNVAGKTPFDLTVICVWLLIQDNGVMLVPDRSCEVCACAATYQLGAELLNRVRPVMCCHEVSRTAGSPPLSFFLSLDLFCCVLKLSVVLFRWQAWQKIGPRLPPELHSVLPCLLTTLCSTYPGIH